jgi:hypothetical protein
MSLREAGELLGVNHQTVSNDIQADIPSHFDDGVSEGTVRRDIQADIPTHFDDVGVVGHLPELGPLVTGQVRAFRRAGTLVVLVRSDLGRPEQHADAPTAACGR